MLGKRLLALLIVTQSCFISAEASKKYKKVSLNLGTSLFDRELEGTYRISKKNAFSIGVTHRFLAIGTELMVKSAKSLKHAVKLLKYAVSLRHMRNYKLKLLSGVGAKASYKRYYTDTFYLEAGVNVGKYFKKWTPGLQFICGWDLFQSNRYGLNVAIGPTALLLPIAVKSLVPKTKVKDVAGLNLRQKMHKLLLSKTRKNLKNISNPSFKSRALFSSADTPLFKIGFTARFK